MSNPEAKQRGKFRSDVSWNVASLAVLGIAGLTLNVLIGEQSFEYHQPICAGDRLLVTSRVVDIYEKMGTGGVMDFVVVEDEGRDDRGELVYRARKTIIVRPPMRPPEAGGPAMPPLAPVFK